MNDRIKELAEQCWNKRPEGQLHFDNEKFAELIVRECAHIAWLNSTEDNISHTVIKKHFGVEE